MAEAGRDRGYAYMAITDHSASHGFGDHVTAERLWERIEEVKAWNKGKRGFRLLAGSEINIGLDGSLDYPDDVVEALDWVVASVHTSFCDLREGDDRPGPDRDREPPGRLHRPPDRPADRPPRALWDRHRGRGRGGGARPARCWRSTATRTAATSPSTTRAWPREAGATIVLNTDAHGVDTLDNMAYAVATARRAWLTAENIANTRTWANFKKLRKR